MVLNELVRERIRTLYENKFQEFIQHLYATIYGNRFTAILQKRDKGCDGVLTHTQTIIAVYGPQNRDIDKFQKKVREDFDKYKANWGATHPGWQVVFNDTFTAKQYEFLTALKADAELVGLERLCTIFQNEPYSHRRKIAFALGIDERFIDDDVLVTVMDDLLHSSSSSSEYIPFNSRTDIETKLALNYSIDDLAIANAELADSLTRFGVLREILASYSDDQQATLRNTIRNDYLSHNGTFRERFNKMIDIYSRKCKNDRIYQDYLRTVLLYYFEQCLIGKKSENQP